MMDILERVRQYPAPVRRMILTAFSTGFTMIVAVMWMTGLASSGKLALTTPSKSDAPQQTRTSDNMAAIVESFTKQMSGESSINIVEATTSSTFEEEVVPMEATVIPF